VVVNDHDAVDPAALPIFRDVREITGIRLPHLPEGVFFKSLPVLHVRVTGGFEAMAAYEPLYSTDADRGGDKGILHQLLVDLRGIEPGERFLKAVDLLNGSIGERAGGTLVRPLFWHQGVNAAGLVKGNPFTERLGAVLEDGAVRERQGLFGDAAVISIPGGVREQAMDHRGDHGQAELRDFGSIRQGLFLVIHRWNPPFSFSPL